MANKSINMLEGEKTEESQTSGFPCDQCEKVFKYKKDLTRHQKAKHSGVTFSCARCGKEFNVLTNKTRHERTCNPGPKQFDCNICGKRCATEGGIRRHQEVHQEPSKPQSEKVAPKRKNKETAASSQAKKGKTSPIPGPMKKRRKSSKEFRCRRCSDVFENRRELYDHGMRQHYQVGGGLQPMPWGLDPAPWEKEDGSIDEQLRDVYETNDPIILEEHEPGPVVSTYNFPVGNDITVPQLMQFAEEIYQREQYAFRLNLVFGVILQNRETGAYRYFRPYINNTVLENPMYISRRKDLQKFKLRLQNLDLITEILRNRPDTKWIPVLITNVVFKTYSTNYWCWNFTRLPQKPSRYCSFRSK